MSNGGWNTIESDAGVFTYLLENLGVKNVQFEELISLDPDALTQLHPVYGVIFLFKVPTDRPYRSASGEPLDGEFDHAAAEDGGPVFFATQTIQNACATQALLSVLLNKAGGSAPRGRDNDDDDDDDDDDDTIDIGQDLRDFRDFAVALPPDFRGEVLSNSELIREVHNRFARSSPFADETQRPRPDPDDDDAAAYHFVAYTAVAGTLYELDGLQPAPIRHGRAGACATPAAFAAAVMSVLQRRVARYGEAEIRFNLLAMVRDLRVRARETGDAELLAREQRKRRDWRFENALRRHNFVGFAGEVMKGVVAAKMAEGPGDDAYRAWVDKAKEKTRKAVEERRKGGGGGGEDVDMQG